MGEGAQVNMFQVSGGGEPWIDVTDHGAYLKAQTVFNAGNFSMSSPYIINRRAG